MKKKEFEELYGRFLDTSSIENKKLNLKYGPYERNLLDIYYPDETKEKYPVIVFFHGGAFMKGDKGRYQLKPALAGLERGYAVVSANYRLIQTNKFPAAVQDAKAVIRYLKAKAEDLKLDAEHMAVWGESAGAVLATMIGCTEGVAEFEDLSMGNEDQNTKVNVVIDWYAPTNLAAVDKMNQDNPGSTMMYDDKYTVNEVMFGCTGEELLEAMKKADPANYLSPGIPPVFIEHGMADEIVPYQISEDFFHALLKYLDKDAGEIELHLVKEGKHGVEDFSNKENLEKVFAFIERWI